MNRAFEVVVVGGGVAGASLARRLASAGASVLVLERTSRFVDRVRGDVMYPWGVTEAKALGLLGVMLEGPARRLPYWRTRFAGFPPPPPRELAQEVGESALAFFHPELQQVLLDSARAAGARVVRGARVTGVTRRASGPQVSYAVRGEARTADAALVVGADGRMSGVSRLAGLEQSADRPRLVLAGTLVTGVPVEHTAELADTNQLYLNPPVGAVAMLLPVDQHRTRVYAGYHLAAGRRPEVGRNLKAFLELAVTAGAPAAALAAATQAGPLAGFDGADRWVQTPYADGVALIGDAAAASDPSFGSGMALALLSARLLADALVAAPTLDAAAVNRAGAAYAADMSRAYGSLHRQTSWLTDFYRTPGAAADAVRARRYLVHAAELWRVPDVVGLGPAGASDEAARHAFLGADRNTAAWT
ncbi:MAG: FAD-dependent oxidoreductase [Trueperaceae bacterium]